MNPAVQNALTAAEKDRHNFLCDASRILLEWGIKPDVVAEITGLPEAEIKTLPGSTPK
jgi:hypothetical protein